MGFNSGFKGLTYSEKDRET